jgi:hypothetical protein
MCCAEVWFPRRDAPERGASLRRTRFHQWIKAETFSSFAHDRFDSGMELPL